MESLRGAARFSRRGALVLTAGATLTASISSRAATGPIRAIAFDGFPIFDPRSVTALARRLLPDKGDMLASLWANKLFAYTWLVTAGGRYQEFESLADASLRFSAESLHLQLTDEMRTQLVGAYSRLDVWPDVKPALAKLRAAGVRLAFLSNLSEAMLRANMDHAGVADCFEMALSTDRVRKFKPAAEAYRMAVNAFGLRKDEIGFAAFGGWDAVGASWFGYRTAWINRVGGPAERLDAKPAIVTPGIEGALALVGLS